MISEYQLPLVVDETELHKDMVNRLKTFNRWLSNTKTKWFEVDLTKYTDYLRDERMLVPSSILAHLSTIRSRYRDLQGYGVLESLLESYAPHAPAANERLISSVRESINRAANFDTHALNAERIPHVVHLTRVQIDELLSKPNLRGMGGLRDAALIGFLLCCGLNEAEVSSLDVTDLIYEEGERFRILVRGESKSQERVVPVYDHVLFDQPWLRQYAIAMMGEGRINHGPLFRGIQRDGESLRPDRITSRAVREILRKYSVHNEDGSSVKVTTLTLRRTLARRLFLAGFDIWTIRANLGIGQTAALEYIGPPNPQADDQDREPNNGLVLLEKLRLSRT